MRRSQLALTLALWTLFGCQRDSGSRTRDSLAELSAARQMVSRGRATVMSAASGGQTVGTLRSGQIVLAIGTPPASANALVEVVAHELRGWTRASGLEPLVLPRAAVSAVEFRASPPPDDPCQITGPFAQHPRLEVWMEPQKRADSVRVEWGCTVGEGSTDYYRIGWLEASPLAFDVVARDPVACKPLFDSLPPDGRRVLDSVWQLHPARCRAIRARTIPQLFPGAGRVSLAWPAQWRSGDEIAQDPIKFPDGVVIGGRWLTAKELRRESVGGIVGPVVMRDGYALVVDRALSPMEARAFRVLLATSTPPALVEVFFRSGADDAHEDRATPDPGESRYTLRADGVIERRRDGKVTEVCYWGATTREYDCEAPRADR